VTVQQVVDEVVAATPGVAWSIMVTGSTAVTASHSPDRRLRTASIGKLLLLAEVARRISDGTLDPDLIGSCQPAAVQDDSGSGRRVSTLRIRPW
jgi:beta-lactamase class A